MPPHSPNMYREPPASPSHRLQQQQQLGGSPSLYRNISAASSSSAPPWAGSPRFQTAVPPGSPASGQSNFVDGQFKPGSPLLRSPPPVIPQSLHLVQQSPQVHCGFRNFFSNLMLLIMVCENNLKLYRVISFGTHNFSSILDTTNSAYSKIWI